MSLFFFNRNASKFSTLFGIALLSSCGDVKVVKDDSSITSVNPMNEVVKVIVDKTADSKIDCLKVHDPVFRFEQEMSVVERDVFSKALTAHLAPLQYPITPECGFNFHLDVAEYNTQDFLVASRLVVSLSAKIRDSVGSDVIWAAEYRFAQNAGAIPLDPISLGIGAVSAARNRSKDSRTDGVYLAVRRLLTALEPRRMSNRVLAVKNDIPKVDDPTFFDSLILWQEGDIEQALELAKKLYDKESMASIGYEYGLMLESSGNEQLAAKVYSETALAQIGEGSTDQALASLRRLEKLNKQSGGRYNDLLDGALVRALER